MLSLAENVADPRGSARSNVFLTAALQVVSGSLAVRVRNLSARGALLDGVDLPAEGTAVRLRRGPLEVQGEVAWQSDLHRGIYFHEDIDVAGWVRAEHHKGQQRVDRLVDTLRRKREVVPGLACSEDSTLQSLSAELGTVCESLAAHVDLRTRAADDLLRLDAVSQRIREWVTNSSIESDRPFGP